MAINLNPIGNPEKVGGFNNNFELIEEELNNNVLRRDGLSPGEANHMEVDLDLNGHAILNVNTDLSNPNSLISLEDAELRYLGKAGDTMSGVLNMAGNSLTNLPVPTQANEAARKSYVDSGDAAERQFSTQGLAGKVSKSGGSMSGPLNMTGNDILNVRTTTTDNLILGGLPVNAGPLNPNTVIYVDTIADLQALDTSELVDGQQVQVKEYYAGTGAGGGAFYYDPGRASENDGGMVLNGFVRIISHRHPVIGPEFFGARYDLSETLVPVDYLSDRPEQRVRITSQTFEAGCVNKCIRWARSHPDLYVTIKISGFIKVYAYLEPLDFNIKISGSSPQTSGFQSMDTSPTNAEGYGIISCGKPQGAGSNFVWIENIKLDGRGSFRTKPDRERRVYNLASYTGSNLYAHNIESVDSPIDCLNVGGETAYVVKSIFKGSYRNTVTAGSVSKWAKLIDCDISEGGYVHGGTNPRYCVDVEPNVSTKPAELVEFIRCKLSRGRNSLVGAVWSTTLWDGCTFDGSEKAPETQADSLPWLGSWAQGNHTISNCLFIGNRGRSNTIHGYNVNNEASELGYDSRVVIKDNLFKGCGMRLFGFNFEIIGNRIENSKMGINALKPSNIDVQRFVIKDNYLYNVISTAAGVQGSIQVQALVGGEVLVEGNTVVFDRNELGWVADSEMQPISRIYGFALSKASSGTVLGTRIILNNTAINYYQDYLEGIVPLTESPVIRGWDVASPNDSPAESWPPMPDDPAFYRGNL